MDNSKIKKLKEAHSRYRERVAGLKKEYRIELRRILGGISERKVAEIKKKLSAS